MGNWSFGPVNPIDLGVSPEPQASVLAQAPGPLGPAALAVLPGPPLLAAVPGKALPSPRSFEEGLGKPVMMNLGAGGSSPWLNTHSPQGYTHLEPHQLPQTLARGPGTAAGHCP